MVSVIDLRSATTSPESDSGSTYEPLCSSPRSARSSSLSVVMLWSRLAIIAVLRSSM